MSWVNFLNSSLWCGEYFNLPDLYVGKSAYTVKAASTGPLVIISVWIFSTPSTEYTDLAEIGIPILFIAVTFFYVGHILNQQKAVSIASLSK